MKKIDPDAPLSDKEWDRLGPPTHGITGLPKEVHKAIAKSRGRPPKAHPKENISIRLDAEIVEYFRAHGKGWQTDINNALLEWVGRRPE